MITKKIREVLERQVQLTNVFIASLGIILILTSCFINNNNAIQTTLLGVGGSLIASSVATWLTSFYTISKNETEEIISTWQLKNIFRTKSEMNVRSNECLENATKSIDIVAIGMATFLNVKRDLLEQKLSKGVRIRIISCDNATMLKQREQDESLMSRSKPLGTMQKEVEELVEWVDECNGDISIKFQSSYPGFSYLRIDNHVFFGPNLLIYKSQQNMAYEYDIRGEGGQYLSEYFETLWKLCHGKLLWRFTVSVK